MLHTVSLPKLALLLVAVTWGASFAFQESLVEYLSPELFTFYNFFGAFLVFLSFCLYKKQNIFFRWKEGLLLGILLAVMELTQMYGLAFSSAANTSFISNIGMLLVPFVGWFLFKHGLSIFHIGTLCLAGLGMYYLVGGVSGFNFGDFMLLISASCMALYFVYSERFESEAKSKMSVLCVQQFFIVSLITACLTLFIKIPFFVESSLITELSWQVIVFTIIPYTLIQWASKYSNEMAVAMYDGVVEPLVGGIVAWGLFKDPVTPVAMLGACIMVFAFALGVVIEYDRHFLFKKRSTP